ncbi:MAG: hypothetical protein ABSA30_00175 [Candidatus Aminicenantales bacterium]|jgi:hypothetical protein
MDKKDRKRFPLIEVYQADGIDAFACYLAPEGAVEGKALIGLNVEAILGTVILGDVEPADVPYVIAESIMHEVTHVIEKWAGVAFSEERVEALIERYMAARARSHGLVRRKGFHAAVSRGRKPPDSQAATDRHG